MDIPDCEECLKLMVEDMAKSAADPKNLALMPPEEAEKATRDLRELLDRPNDSLEAAGEASRLQGQSKRSGSSKANQRLAVQADYHVARQQHPSSR